jgi:hypothetical protein
MITKKIKKITYTRGFYNLFFSLVLLVNAYQPLHALSAIEKLSSAQVKIIIIAIRKLPQLEHPENIDLLNFTPLEKAYYNWLFDSLSSSSQRISVLAALTDALFTEKFSFLGQQYEPLFRARMNTLLNNIKANPISLKTGWVTSKKYMYSSFSALQQQLIDLIALQSLTLLYSKKLQDSFEEKFVRLKAQIPPTFSKKTLKKQTMIVVLHHIAQTLEEKAKIELDMLQKTITDKALKEYTQLLSTTILKNGDPFDLSSFDITLPIL